MSAATQILGEEQNVTIILANGKEYDCHVSADLTLAAGQKTILTAELKASESSTFQPKLTTIPNATSAFSGNRLFCAIKDNSTDEFSYHIYDLQPDVRGEKEYSCMRMRLEPHRFRQISTKAS